MSTALCFPDLQIIRWVQSRVWSSQWSLPTTRRLWAWMPNISILPVLPLPLDGILLSISNSWNFFLFFMQFSLKISLTSDISCPFHNIFFSGILCLFFCVLCRASSTLFTGCKTHWLVLKTFTKITLLCSPPQFTSLCHDDSSCHYFPQSATLNL